MNAPVTNIDPNLVPSRQQPLQQRYRKDPDAALIRDEARAVMGAATDPFHGEVEPANNAGKRWSFGIHQSVDVKTVWHVEQETPHEGLNEAEVSQDRPSG